MIKRKLDVTLILIHYQTNMEHPQPGDYYYHFKHDPSVIEDHAYEIIGRAIHSETEEKVVVYKPLYKGNFTEENNVDFMIRPLSNFIEEVNRDGNTFSRFSLITDPYILSELKKRN